MSNNSKSLSQVQAIREQNVPFVFNMIAALEAVEKTEPKVRKSGALSGLSKNILEVCKGAGKPLATNQILTALLAGGMTVTSKQVCDKCWLLAKSGKLVKCEEKGMYKIAEKTSVAE